MLRSLTVDEASRPALAFVPVRVDVGERCGRSRGTGHGHGHVGGHRGRGTRMGDEDGGRGWGTVPWAGPMLVGPAREPHGGPQESTCVSGWSRYPASNRSMCSRSPMRRSEAIAA